MQTDTTMADQHIEYLSENGILNKNRKKSENMIDELYDWNSKQGVKPRTYRCVINTAFLDYSKKNKKSKVTHRKMTRKLLECVNRYIKHIDHQLDEFEQQGLLGG